MKHRHISKKRATMAGGAVAALVVAGISFQTANASEGAPQFAVKSLSATAAGTLSSHLNKDLGSDAAGSYYDAKSKALVVNVVDDQAAEVVRQAGGKARVVENSAKELTAARKTLAAKAAIPGTSWSVDPVSNKVVVKADRTVKGAQLTKLNSVVDGLGGKVELKRSAGEFKPFVSGGDAVTGPVPGGTARCSVGFNVTVGGAPYFITAGHCTADIQTWSDAQGNQIGTTEGSDFPGHDYGLVKYNDGVDHPSEVNLYDGSAQPISGAAEATVGQSVTRSGSTTQVHSGTVLGLDATVNYGNGDIVNGLIDTDVCAEPGDSGGSLFSGSSAIGLTSGGSGDCSSGGETFFQPATAALAAFGAEIG
ncbi:streptogrisin [Streptomyces sp. AcH 505]|uniref:S1 family peptidase n=1 Tax=unclassified Streptomyces TaxID=2593676 RepID=UPI000591D64A|nr:S1 family peptidase [Streptomyces sp. NBC_00370]KIF70546.1 streptogrisin [Streptomyces sp. AcH 505]